jgi:hypothetical protein
MTHRDKIRQPLHDAGLGRWFSDGLDCLSWWLRLAELTIPTSEGRNTLPFYLTLSPFNSPIMDDLPWTIKRRVIRLGNISL